MERMNGGQDTWAKWKAALMDLPDDQLHAYLHDVESFSDEQIEQFVRDGITTRPDDWEITPESKAAMARYYAWEARAAEPGREAAAVEQQQARGAALPAESAKETGWRNDISG